MHPDALYFSILLCLTPDDFTRQVESAAAQWVKYVYCTSIGRVIRTGRNIAIILL